MLFHSTADADHATPILQAILDAHSARVSEIAQKMAGTAEANYKQIQRFIEKVDVKSALLRLFQDDAPFVLGNPTEIPRPQAYRTPYAGTLKDGKTKGFSLLFLTIPERGRAVPCHFVTYSSRTIAQQANSRNFQHVQAFQGLNALLGEKPLVLDREFSYLELLDAFAAAQINFVIRLNLDGHPLQILDAEGQRDDWNVEPGKTVVYRQVRYKGKAQVNVIGTWQVGYAEPLWVMTNLAAEWGVQIYFARMKIEEPFRDLKSLLGLEKVMNKQQAKMEQLVALVLLAFTLGLLVGETLRDVLYGAGGAEVVAPAPVMAPNVIRTKFSDKLELLPAPLHPSFPNSLPSIPQIVLHYATPPAYGERRREVLLGAFRPVRVAKCVRGCSRFHLCWAKSPSGRVSPSAWRCIE